MDPVHQEQVEPLPHSAKTTFHHIHKGWLLPIAITILTTAIAVIWALSDTGQIDSHWGELALIFFTWIAVVLGTWAYFRIKE